MDICSYENLNRLPRQKVESKRLQNTHQSNKYLVEYGHDDKDFHQPSQRDLKSSSRNKIIYPDNELGVENIHLHKRNINDSKQINKNLHENKASKSGSTVHGRSISTIIPYSSERYELDFKRKHSFSPKHNTVIRNNIFEEIHTISPSSHQNNRRNTEILSTQNFFTVSTLLNSKSKSNSSKSSEEFNNTSRSWYSNDSDFLSPERYQTYNDVRKTSTLSVPDGNMLKSKSFSSFKIDQNEYLTSGSQEIVNAETLVVPTAVSGRLIRHKSCDSTSGQNYILHIPDTRQRKNSKKNLDQRKYSQGDPNHKGERNFFSQAFMSLKRKQEAFFKKLPKPHQPEEPPVTEECTVDPVYHLLKCASYTAHNPHNCECPCHTLPNPEILKHAQSHVQLPTINFKSKYK